MNNLYKSKPNSIRMICERKWMICNIWHILQFWTSRSFYPYCPFQYWGEHQFVRSFINYLKESCSIRICDSDNFFIMSSAYGWMWHRVQINTYQYAVIWLFCYISRYRVCLQNTRDQGIQMWLCTICLLAKPVVKFMSPLKFQLSF